MNKFHLMIAALLAETVMLTVHYRTDDVTAGAVFDEAHATIKAVSDHAWKLICDEIERHTPSDPHQKQKTA